MGKASQRSYLALEYIMNIQVRESKQSNSSWLKHMNGEMKL